MGSTSYKFQLPTKKTFKKGHNSVDKVPTITLINASLTLIINIVSKFKFNH